jgi:hypothetical protein
MSTLIAISACFMMDDIETNEYAMMAIEMENREEEIYIQENGEEQQD